MQSFIRLLLIASSLEQNRKKIFFLFKFSCSLENILRHDITTLLVHMIQNFVCCSHDLLFSRKLSSKMLQFTMCSSNLGIVYTLLLRRVRPALT